MILKEKTVLISGSNRGIGRAIAEELAQYPVHLLLGMRNPASFTPIENSKALSIKPVLMDMGSQASIDKSLELIKKDLDSLDILINNAGQFVAGALQNQNSEKVALMFQVNLIGLTYLTGRLLPTLLKRPEAKIVNNASIAGYAYLPFNSTYSATKAGVVAFSESLRRELVKTNVGVLHLVTPVIDTEMMDDVEKTYKEEGRPLNLKRMPASKWAKKIVQAIEKDKDVLSPSGSTELLKLMSHGPSFLVDGIAKRLVK
jgi:short-subunit dehydrogenase